jgi:hypothetical protein
MTWNTVEKPPTKGTYWVTIERPNKTRFVVEAEFNIDYTYSMDPDWFFYSYDGNREFIDEYGTVLAWMPIQKMPEPLSG